MPHPADRVCDRFRADGFVRMDRFLDDGEVADVRDTVNALPAVPFDATCARPNNTLVPLRFTDAVVETLLGSPRRVRRLAEAVEARDLRWISGYVSIKEPRSAALSWHQDWWCWSHPISFGVRPVQVALLCYLTQTDRSRGALRVLPGSHLRGDPLHGALSEADPTDGPLAANHAAMSDHPEQVTVSARPGDAVVLDYRVLHGTHANSADCRRDCVLLSFTPAWSDLPEDLRAHLIQHPAQPRDGESPRAALTSLMPTFRGVRRDLPLDRDPPSEFAVRA